MRVSKNTRDSECDAEDAPSKTEALEIYAEPGLKTISNLISHTILIEKFWRVNSLTKSSTDCSLLLIMNNTLTILWGVLIFQNNLLMPCVRLNRMARRVVGRHLVVKRRIGWGGIQGYLAREKQRPPRTLRQDYA